MKRTRSFGCREALAHLVDFLNEEARNGVRRKMEYHLKRCEGCAARVKFERQLQSRFRAVGLGAIRASFQKRMKKLLQALEKE